MKYPEWKRKFVDTNAAAGYNEGTGGGKMNILPNAAKAVIPIEKLTKYALDPMNSRGKWIAFQEALGYNLENADMLLSNIKQSLINYSAEQKGDKGYGQTYAVLMELTGANDRTASVMTAWLDDKSTGEMRLTSIYVKKRKGDLHD
ncbi:MAG: hypothetical protein LBR76_06835 [Oscillospiraceae bacterium]|jgi:hypothetical protein|nr:hypothetical protein [Oscillospiraceae bacterium]